MASLSTQEKIEIYSVLEINTKREKIVSRKDFSPANKSKE